MVEAAGNDPVPEHLRDGALFDAIRQNRWRMIAGGVTAGVVMTAIPLLLNPWVLNQYADAMGNRPPSTVVDCTKPRAEIVREGTLSVHELRRAVGRLAP